MRFTAYRIDYGRGFVLGLAIGPLAVRVIKQVGRCNGGTLLQLMMTARKGVAKDGWEGAGYIGGRTLWLARNCSGYRFPDGGLDYRARPFGAGFTRNANHVPFTRN